MDCSTPDLSVLHCLPECSDSCPLSWWCYLTILSSAGHFSFAFDLSQHQGLFQWVFSSHQMANVLELQLQLLWVSRELWKPSIAELLILHTEVFDLESLINNNHHNKANIYRVLTMCQTWVKFYKALLLKRWYEDQKYRNTWDPVEKHNLGLELYLLNQNLHFCQDSYWFAWTLNFEKVFYGVNLFKMHKYSIMQIFLSATVLQTKNTRLGEFGYLVQSQLISRGWNQ